MRIAIIGTGISGLVAAHHLHRDHEVTLFEAGDHIGGHTHTHDVTFAGEEHAIDTGFIVFNEANYPQFCSLLRSLGVESQPTSMSFSVRCDKSGIEYNGSSLNQIFTQRLNLFRPGFLRMLRDIMRFNREAIALVSSGGTQAAVGRASAPEDDATTVDEFVAQHKLGRAFYERYLVPLGASLWSCPAEKFRQFPIRFVIEFLHNHSMLQYAGRPTWRTVKGGSKQYVEPLVRPFRERIQLKAPVECIKRQVDCVKLIMPGGAQASFDHVIVACHADTALALLADASPLERELLSAFPYQKNEAILHTDASVLPRSHRAWASWNYHIPLESTDQVSVTYNMNMLQNLNSKHTFCVTLNRIGDIEPSRILKRITYHHPTYTIRRAWAQGQHRAMLNVNRSSFCGAYWGYGFHEDGVRSGLAVAEALKLAAHG